MRPRSAGPVPGLALVLALVLALGVVAGPGAMSRPALAQEAGATTPWGDYLAARHAEQIDDLATAARLQRHLLTLAPDNLSLLNSALVLSLSNGDHELARDIAGRIVATDQVDFVAPLVLAVAALADDDPRRAEAWLAQLPDAGINRVVGPLVLAWTEAANGDLEAAIRTVGALADDQNVPALSGLHFGLLLELSGDAAAAEAVYVRLLAELDRPPLRVVHALAALLSASDRHDQAQDLMATYVAADEGRLVIGPAAAEYGGPDQFLPLAPTAKDGVAEVLFDIAAALHDDNGSRQALPFLQLALMVRPDFDLALLLLADIHETLGRWPDAAAAYERIDGESGWSWLARVRAAQIPFELDRLHESEAALRQLAKERPDSADPWIALGDLFRRSDDFRRAARAYEEGFNRLGALEQRHWRILYVSAIAYERSDEWSAAEAQFLQALEFVPEQPQIMNYLAYSWVDQGLELDRALPMLTRAVELRPRDGYILDSLGWVYYRLDDFDNAVLWLERAAALTPGDPTINDHLGDAYWQVGRLREARFQWRRALAFEPEPDVESAIQRKLRQGLDRANTGP